MYTRLEVDAGGNRIGLVTGEMPVETPVKTPVKKVSTKGMVKVTCTEENGGMTVFITTEEYRAFKEWAARL